jgi:phage-related baseplate assembly protein
VGAKEFMEVAKTLTPKIKTCTDVAGFERVMAQEVLQAVSRSVMVNGAQQHGLKQVKLKAALKVFSILAAERDKNTEQEQAVLNALVIIASGAIRR